FDLLLGNCFELRAQLKWHAKDLTGARKELARAEALVKGRNFQDRILIEKWRAIVDATEASDPSILQRFRARAREAKHWETLRDCDYHQARLTGDINWVRRLWCGTSYFDFRARLLREFPALVGTQEIWMSRSSSRSGVKIDPLA